MKIQSAQDILDKKDLHWSYAPNGDNSKPRLHDRDCRFCEVEERVLEAMKEYGREVANAVKAACVKKVSGLNKTMIYPIDIEDFIK